MHWTGVWVKWGIPLPNHRQGCLQLVGQVADKTGAVLVKFKQVGMGTLDVLVPFVQMTDQLHILNGQSGLVGDHHQQLLVSAGTDADSAANRGAPTPRTGVRVQRVVAVFSRRFDRLQVHAPRLGPR